MPQPGGVLPDQPPWPPPFFATASVAPTAKVNAKAAAAANVNRAVFMRVSSGRVACRATCLWRKPA
jgi:hypothetical protein